MELVGPLRSSRAHRAAVLRALLEAPVAAESLDTFLAEELGMALRPLRRITRRLARDDWLVIRPGLDDDLPPGYRMPQRIQLTEHGRKAATRELHETE